MAPNAPCLCVNVRSEQWELMTFTANQTDKVKKINEHIRSKTKVHVQDQVLLLGSKTLRPERSLSSYGIDKEETIHLTLKVVKPTDEEVPLVLIDLDDDGRKYHLLVWRSYSVAQVKKMIEMKTGITPETQTVNCNGKTLEDGKKMADYDIRKDNFLFLTCRCYAG